MELTATHRRILPVPALLAMVAALLLLSAGPLLSGDFAGRLPNHSHVYLGAPNVPHSHEYTSPNDEVLNVPSSDAGLIALSMVPLLREERSLSSDTAPWLNSLLTEEPAPDGLVIDPLQRPPVS